MCPTPRATPERRAPRRPSGRTQTAAFRILRTTAEHAGSFRAAAGIFLVGGGALTVIALGAFLLIAARVGRGPSQAFDEAVLRWMGAHRDPLAERVFLEITALGTAAVVLVVVAITALYLALLRQRWAARLLLVATAGELALNPLLKLAFDRPRPRIFPWATAAFQSSFPSGHAMSATVVYAMVALIAIRLQRRSWHRWLTGMTAALLVFLICASRLYLGVHYPSDVLAGVVVGLAWAGLCMTGLEVVQRLAEHRDPA